MKFDFTINIAECDEGYSFQDEIIQRAADSFIYRY
jgi:hypothetical protein